MTDADETRAQEPGARAAQAIGPYRLLEPIGDGGMGEVWLAEQAKPVRRKVALKIIKAGMDTAQVVARFEAERQALALMDHPAIARVFEAGATAAGRPYFAMEYVRGESIIVEGIGQYPSNGGTAANGPYDGTWWGGNLQGVNGNSTNPGAPIVLNAGGNATSLGPPVANKVVYSAHDYGPHLYKQSWFNANTCYTSGCGPSSQVDVWTKFWAYINIGNVNPTWPGHASYPWSNTGHTAYTVAPMYLGEFGTGNTEADVTSLTRGTQGQWFTNAIGFVQSSRTRTTANDPGINLTNLHATYWALNDEDAYAILGAGYTGLEYPRKLYSFICFIQDPRFRPAACGSTGPLPNPF